MDKEQARFLLSACQPSLRDGSQPEIVDALALAQHDPELREWLHRERQSDAAISQQLRALEPPAHLRAQLLAGGRASHRATPRRQRTWRTPLGLAASILLATAAGWWGHARFFAPREEGAAVASLRAWQEHCVGVFADPLFHLDLEGAEYPPLARHLSGQHARVAEAPPFNARVVAAVGCKVLEWRGTTVSLTCFRADTGELVHLFVAPRQMLAAEMAALASHPQRAQLGDFATVTWQDDDLVIMVASKLPASRLEQVLAPAQSA